MDILQHLNEVNDVPVHAVTEKDFAPYGKVLAGYDFSDAIGYMEQKTSVPESGNCYQASVPELEALPFLAELSATVYGGMPVQAGFCNGRNSNYNGFEWHKGSEINIAVTDFLLVLGLFQQIQEGNRFDNRDAKVFFVPRGTAIEMYQTTLHLSPLKVTDAGFKAIVVLPRGTNTPLTQAEKESRDRAFLAGDRELQLLLQRNKWVIAHPQREALIAQGAFPGIVGENKELFY